MIQDEDWQCFLPGKIDADASQAARDSEISTMLDLCNKEAQRFERAGARPIRFDIEAKGKSYALMMQCVGADEPVTLAQFKAWRKDNQLSKAA